MSAAAARSPPQAFAAAAATASSTPTRVRCATHSRSLNLQSLQKENSSQSCKAPASKDLHRAPKSLIRRTTRSQISYTHRVCTRTPSRHLTKHSLADQIDHISAQRRQTLCSRTCSSSDRRRRCSSHRWRGWALLLLRGNHLAPQGGRVCTRLDLR